MKFDLITTITALAYVLILTMMIIAESSVADLAVIGLLMLIHQQLCMLNEKREK